MTGRNPSVDGRRVPRWPLLLIALPAFVAIWSGWVGLGRLTGFGPVVLLPGIADEWVIDSAITLPIGVEAYAAYALFVWLAPDDAQLSTTARRFACWSSVGALVLGMAGQVAYHLMAAAGMQVAPWQITAFVACLPVAVVGCAAALVHLRHHTTDDADEVAPPAAKKQWVVADIEHLPDGQVIEHVVEVPNLPPAPDVEKVDERGLSLAWNSAPAATPKPVAKVKPAARRARSAFLENPPPRAIELAQQHGKDVLRRKVREECGIEISEHEAKQLIKDHRNNGPEVLAS